MWVICGAAGGILAALYFLGRNLSDLISAWSTGVISGKSRRNAKVSRSEEPERFRRMCDARLAIVVPSVLILAVSTALLYMQVSAILAMDR